MKNFFLNRSLSRFLSVAALVVVSSAKAIPVDFDSSEYIATAGGSVSITLTFGEPVPGGLAGYHLSLNAATAGVFDPDDSVVIIVPELDNNLSGDGPATRSIVDSGVEILGFAEFGSPYSGQDFVTFQLAISPNAAAGEYLLSLEIPVEDGFVNGDFEAIDDDMVFGSATLTIEVPAPAIGETPVEFDTDTGSAILSFVGVPQRDYLIEVSEDLENWTELTMIAADSSGEIHFTDPDAELHPRRFYRLVD